MQDVTGLSLAECRRIKKISLHMPFSPAMAIYCARDEVHIYRLKDSNWAGGSNMLAQYLIHSTARNSKCTRALETHGHIQ